jgi:hypothetical protein
MFALHSFPFSTFDVEGQLKSLHARDLVSCNPAPPKQKNIFILTLLTRPEAEAETDRPGLPSSLSQNLGFV